MKACRRHGTDGSKHHTEDAEIKHNAITRFVESAHLLHLPVGGKINERHTQANQRGNKFVCTEPRLHHKANAYKARDNGQHHRPRRSFPLALGKNDEIQSHK